MFQNSSLKLWKVWGGGDLYIWGGGGLYVSDRSHRLWRKKRPGRHASAHGIAAVVRHFVAAS